MARAISSGMPPGRCRAGWLASPTWPWPRPSPATPASAWPARATRSSAPSATARSTRFICCTSASRRERSTSEMPPCTWKQWRRASGSSRDDGNGRDEEGDMRFTGKVALITAAASGIGKATAEIIGKEGGIVVGVDVDEGRLEKALAAIRDAGGRAHGLRADALDAAQVTALVGRVVEE